MDSMSQVPGDDHPGACDIGVILCTGWTAPAICYNTGNHA